MRLSFLLASFAAAGLTLAACDDGTAEPTGDAGPPGNDATVPLPDAPDTGSPTDAAVEDADAADAPAPMDAGGDAEPDAEDASRSSVCGDGVVEGAETCDVGAEPSADDQLACIECTLQAGWVCPPGEGCRQPSCGDGDVEGVEQCEDGNARSGDGCSPTCMLEPLCTADGCAPRCGDGVIDAGEGCDDGNWVTGDGCSAACAVEEGWQCALLPPAPERTMPILYRDFRGYDLPASGALLRGHVDFESSNGMEMGIVQALLGEDGLPVYGKEGVASATTHGKLAFDQWYRATPDRNVTVPSLLTLTRQPDGTYRFAADRFFPIDDAGWRTTGEEPLRNDTQGVPRNFSFTSELHAWFRYSGTEVLSFTGDDDVWIFVNRHLAIDLGGVHGPASGTVTMSQRAQQLGLQEGTLYEIAVFQAERHTSGSSYRLTLPPLPDRSACSRLE